MATEVTRGYFLPYLDFTAFPFDVPALKKSTGTVTAQDRYVYRYADFVMYPLSILPVVVLPILAVMITMKGVK